MIALRVVAAAAAFALSAVPLCAFADPSPSPSPAASTAPSDPCGGATSNLLATLNRPTIGFSACAVKMHESIWELGYQNQVSSRSDQAAYPQGFLRFGAARNVELDVNGPAYGVQRAPGGVIRGAFDSGVGLKYEYYRGASDLAAVDVIYNVPTGSAALTTGGPGTIVNLDYSRSLSPATGIGITIGGASLSAQRLDGTNARISTLLPSAVVTALLNDRTQLYAEVFGQTHLRPDGGSLLGYDYGVQRLLAPQLELDVELGSVATDVSRSHYLGIGFGLRL